MDSFNVIADAIGNIAAVIAAVGVLMVNAKLERLKGRADEQSRALTAHINAPGLHG